MSVIVGTTISGTYADGPGLPSQSHLVYAANAGVWWLFVVTSAADTAGNPGTHTVKCYYSSGRDLATATWTAGTDAPNFDGSGANTAAKLEGGRAMGCLYWNNAAGSNKDIVLVSAAMQNPTKATGGNSYNGIIRAVLTATTITWDSWGGHTETAWNNVAGHVFQAANVLGRTTDGYIQVAGTYLHSEVDAAALTSVDPDTGDTWMTGNLAATGNTTANNAVVTAMSNQTRLKAGMAISYEAGDYNTCRYPKTNTLDSGTQVTASHQFQTASTAGPLRWWQFTGGSNRIQLDTPMIDLSMTNEAQCHAFAPLASGGMLCIYDTGAQTPPSFDNLSSRKANQTQAQGFWPATAAAGVDVFGSTSVQDIQDWCCAAVSTTSIFVLRRTGATTIAMRTYSTGGDTWSAGTAPPALTGKTIKAGGGLMAVTDGVNFWLFLIDSTDNAIKYCKYTVAGGTWDAAWTTLESVSSTATKLAGYPTVAGSRAALLFTETNGGNFDQRVAQLSFELAAVSYPNDADMGIQQRMG